MTAITRPTLRKTTLYLLIAALLAIAVGLSVRTLSKLDKASAATVTGKVCGNAATGNTIDTVVVIAEENRSWSAVGGVGFGDPAMPYTHSVAAQCGVFANDTEINTSENSLTQYIGGWTGMNDPNGISNDCMPPSTTCSYSGNNIQRVFRNANIPSKSYVEGATTGCSASGNAAKHVPEMYMWDPVDKAACPNEVRPLTEFNFASPPTGFSFITPTLCNDGHDCGNATVDTWLSTRLQSIFDSTAYKAGKVLVQVWYDEDHPKPNLFACWSCANFNNTTTDPHYSGESSLWLNLLGAPLTNLGGISTGPDIRPIVFGQSQPPPVDNPPAVNMTAPAGGATLTTSPVTVSANATDDIGVTKVEFYDGSTLIGTDTTGSSGSYSVSWNTSALSGSHSLTAKAYDGGGHVTTSSVVTVTVSITATCPNNITGIADTATMVVSIPAQGTYHLWNRIMAPDATNNSMYVQIDSACPMVAGDSTSIAANTWTWVDYQNGDPTAHVTATLSAGNHTLTVAKRETGIKLDRVLLLSDTCVPTGTGDNCIDTTGPVVSVTAPVNGATVAGQLTLSASATDSGSGVAKVEFLVDGTVIGTSTTSPYQTAWNSTSVADGTHTIQARATDTVGNVTTSAGITVTTKNADTTPPSVPTNLAVTKNIYNEVDLSWGASADNTGGTGLGGYNVYRNSVLLGTVTTTTYNDTTAQANTNYTYAVEAFDKASPPNKSAQATVNDTTPAAPDTTKPSAPTNLAVTKNVYNEVDVSWGASTDTGGSGLQGYFVRRNGVVISPLLTTTTYNDTTVQPSTAYSYDVIARDVAQNVSDPSNTQSITTPAKPDLSPPTTPTNLITTTITSTQVGLSWTASTDDIGVVSYDIYRDSVKIGSSTSTTYGDGTVTAGQSYVYYVVALDASGKVSAASNQVTAQVPASTQPVTVTTEPSDDAGLHKSHSNNNYGLGSTMTADANQVENFIMKFKVSGIGTRTVTSAQLRLWNIDSSDSGGQFHPVTDNNWQESTVTWNNAPVASPTTLFSLGSVTSNNYYLIDLSNYITADGTYSIRIDNTSTNSASYSSHNAPTQSHHPLLTITAQ